MLFTEYYCSQTKIIIGVRVVKSITPWIPRGPQVRNSKLNENKSEGAKNIYKSVFKAIYKIQNEW